MMPPTLAAATKIASGRWRSIHPSTSAWRRKSSSSRLAVRMAQSSRWRRRTIAEPTMPRWPATKTFRPVSENSLRTMSALLFADAGQITLHHLPHQLLERDAMAPSENLVCLCGVPQERSHLGGAKVTRVDSHHGGAGRGIDRDLVRARSAPLDAAAGVAESALYKFANRMRLA